MYQMKLFPTLDSYMSRKRDKVSQTVHAKIENRIEALMKERYKKFFECKFLALQFRFTASCIELQFLPHKNLTFCSA